MDKQKVGPPTNTSGAPPDPMTMPVGVAVGAGSGQQHQYASAANAAAAGLLGGHMNPAVAAAGVPGGVGMGDAWRNMTPTQQHQHRQQLQTFWR